MKSNFPVYLESDDDFATFGVVIPDLPGCVSAGESVEEALAMAKEAIEFHLEGIAEDGNLIPHPAPIVSHLHAKPEWFVNPGLWAVVTVDLPAPIESV